MKINLLKHPRGVRYFQVLILCISLLLPASISPAAQTIEVIVEEPQLTPIYTNCADSAWDPFENIRGSTTYLTLNVAPPVVSTNSGIWKPTLVQDGYYRVEAYIAGHAATTWCGTGGVRDHDTTEARYTIHHAGGESHQTVSQYPLSDQWLDLGEYYFIAGNTGYVLLTDQNSETSFSTTVSFSAMRFTYTRATRPQTYLPLVHRTQPSEPLPPNVGVIQGQGFDVCVPPLVSTMQTWWNESPYLFYGLYLGGITLPLGCPVATASWVSAVHQQGWSFVPIWDGLQAPCYGYKYPMSSDPAISYQQGRQEAQSASAAAQSVGLANSGLGGTIIYYDMEGYGGDLACRQAVKAFMNGWVERLHELGNLAGGYGGSCSSSVSDWSTIPHVPDDVWPALWYTDYYDAYASVFNLPCLANYLWSHHQRVRQYAGDDHESWGNIGMFIDRNVADGVVAMPPSGALVSPVVISSPGVEDTGWLSADQGWLVSGGHLYWTSDQGKNWKDISPAAVQAAYVLPSGQAWAIKTLNDGKPTIYYSSDWGASWESNELSLELGEWKPLALQFTSTNSGWLALQKATSQAFDVAVLLKSDDGGHTWQTYDLPTAGIISFTNIFDGWLLNAEQEQLYHTTDGGLTWETARLNEYPLIQSSLPAGTTLSGWLTPDLGWAATSNGDCQGEKLSPGFTCQVDHALWLTLDGGNTWNEVTLPKGAGTKP